MTTRVTEIRTTIVPTLRYRAGRLMVTWLCEAFGFEQQLIVSGGNGDVKLAQLRLGDNLIMVTTDQDSPIDKLMSQPEEVGGIETQSCYIAVRDIDAHRARAKAAGANVLFDIDITFDTSATRGGRGYVCRDLEGHIWTFGTYDPWQGQPPPGSGDAARKAGPNRFGLWIGGAVAAALVLGSVVGHNIERLDVFSILPETETAAGPSEPGEAGDGLRAQLTAERNARAAAERSARELAQELARERSARESAERAVSDAEARIALARNARAAEERASSDSQRLLEQERAARVRAERLATEASEKLTRESAARQLAERSAREAQDLLLPERNARLAAELAASELRNELHQREGASPERSRSLREQLDVERNERAAAEQAARTARQQLAQERALREAAERALKQAQDKLSATPAAPSCWLLPEGASGPCRQPQ